MTEAGLKGESSVSGEIVSEMAVFERETMRCLPSLLLLIVIISLQ